jgi:hypothetical protein
MSLILWLGDLNNRLIMDFCDVDKNYDFINYCLYVFSALSMLFNLLSSVPDQFHVLILNNQTSSLKYIINKNKY